MKSGTKQSSAVGKVSQMSLIDEVPEWPSFTDSSGLEKIRYLKNLEAVR